MQVALAGDILLRASISDQVQQFVLHAHSAVARQHAQYPPGWAEQQVADWVQLEALHCATDVTAQVLVHPWSSTLHMKAIS